MTEQRAREMDLPGELQIAIGDCGEPGNRPAGWPYPSFDAQHWVEEFTKQHPEIDQGEMIGWFANAIMAGFDHANRTTALAESAKSPSDSVSEALDILRRQLPDLDAAAAPTKCETYVICGAHARAVHSAIETVAAALQSSEADNG